MSNFPDGYFEQDPELSSDTSEHFEYTLPIVVEDGYVEIFDDEYDYDMFTDLYDSEYDVLLVSGSELEDNVLSYMYDDPRVANLPNGIHHVVVTIRVDYQIYDAGYDYTGEMRNQDASADVYWECENLTIVD